MSREGMPSFGSRDMPPPRLPSVQSSVKAQPENLSRAHPAVRSRGTDEVRAYDEITSDQSSDVEAVQGASNFPGSPVRLAAERGNSGPSGQASKRRQGKLTEQGPDDDDRLFHWAYKEDLTLEEEAPVGITFEWRAGLGLCVSSFTSVSPARDSGVVLEGMVLTAINGTSVVLLGQRDVLGAMQAVGRRRRTLTFAMPPKAASHPRPRPPKPLPSLASFANQHKARSEGEVKDAAVQCVQSLARRQTDSSEDMLTEDDETQDLLRQLGLPDFQMAEAQLISQPEDRDKYRARRPSKYFLQKYRGLFPKDDLEDISTPARRRRIVHEVAKFAYLHYRVMACRNVLRWRAEMRAATQIQACWRRFAAMKSYAEMLAQRRLGAATTVQRYVRGHLARVLSRGVSLDRLLLRQEQSAKQLQALVRRKLARRERERRKHNKLQALRIEADAATTIQRSMRMLVGRKKTWEEKVMLNNHATRLQTQIRRYQAQKRYTKQLARAVESVKLIQRVFRSFHKVQKTVRHDAAIRLQRWASQHQSRRRVVKRTTMLIAEREREAAAEARHRARENVREEERIALQEIMRAAAMDAAVVALSRGLANDSGNTDMPRPVGGMFVEAREVDASGGDGTPSMVDSIDILAQQLRKVAMSVCGSQAYEPHPPGSQSSLPSCLLDQPGIVEMLSDLDTGSYHALQDVLDGEADTVVTAGVTAPEFVVLVLHSAARKIQRALKRRWTRRAQAAYTLGRACANSRRRYAARCRLRAIKRTIISLQTAVRGRLARCRVARLREARLERVSRLVWWSIEEFEPLLITPALVDRASRKPLSRPAVSNHETESTTATAHFQVPFGCDGAEQSGSPLSTPAMPATKLLLRWSAPGVAPMEHKAWISAETPNLASVRPRRLSQVQTDSPKAESLLRQRRARTANGGSRKF